jgi:hypothetical protein
MAPRALSLVSKALLFLASSALLSCATTFVGDAQFPGGALGCFKQCQKVGMEMASFVYVGEYSSACACKLKSTGPAQSSAKDADPDVDGAVVAAGAGVEMQRRRAEAAQQQAWTPKP